MTARPLIAAFIHAGPETAFILNCAKLPGRGFGDH